MLYTMYSPPHAEAFKATRLEGIVWSVKINDVVKIKVPFAQLRNELYILYRYMCYVIIS
jgi:hypothetical protein